MQRIYAPKYVKMPIFTDPTIATDSTHHRVQPVPTRPYVCPHPITGSRFYALRARVLGLPI